MIFDWTVSIGNLLTIVGFLGLGLIFVLTMRADIRVFDQRIAGVERDLQGINASLQQITTVMMTLARQDERMSALDRRVNDVAIRVFALEGNGNGLPPRAA